jgi:hypothetical protein
MRGLVVLVFVFGAVAIAYAFHWSRRAVETVKDASTVLRQTGSFNDTVDRLIVKAAIPSEMRLNARQEAYINANWDDFRMRYGANIHLDTNAATADWASKRTTLPTDAEIQKQVELCAAVFHMRYGKIYCETKNIY